MPSSDRLHPRESSYSATTDRLRRRAWISLAFATLMLGFDLAGFRTNWMLPKPLFCGQILAGGTWVSPVSSDVAVRPGTQLVCVHEIIKPYSALSGSATVSLSVREYNRSLTLYDTQFFIAKDVGPSRFNDQPGDWIFLNTSQFSAQGWLTKRSTNQVASWSSGFLTSELRENVWRMLQDELLNKDIPERISLQRNLAVFVAINGGLLIVALLALNSLYQLLKEQSSRLQFVPSSPRFFRLRLDHRDRSIVRWGWQRGAFMLCGLGLLVGTLVVSRFTRWLQPRPFVCKEYALGWQVCLHEIHQLPSAKLRMSILGVSVKKPDQSSIYTKMQFFTALSRDKIGFEDVPGSWHFMDRLYFNPDGWLTRRAPQTLSSIVDPLLPADVQLSLWNHVAYRVQDSYKSRRLSLQSKLLELSESYLLLLLGVILSVWTLLFFLEYRLFKLTNDQETLQT